MFNRELDYYRIPPVEDKDHNIDQGYSARTVKSMEKTTVKASGDFAKAKKRHFSLRLNATTSSITLATYLPVMSMVGISKNSIAILLLLMLMVQF